MEKKTHRITSKDARGGTCTYVSNESTGIYTESTCVHGSTCPYISTKDIGIHGGTSTDFYMVKVVVQGIMNTYYKYRRYKPKRDIGTDVVGKVRKGIRYADALHQGS